MAVERLRNFARDALAALAADRIEHARTLGAIAPVPLVVHVRTGGRFAIVRDARSATLGVDDVREGVRVTITVDGDRVGTLIAGERSVLDAVRAGDLDARGRAEDLVAAERALRVFLEGAARSARVSALFLRWIERRRERA